MSRIRSQNVSFISFADLQITPPSRQPLTHAGTNALFGNAAYFIFKRSEFLNDLHCQEW